MSKLIALAMDFSSFLVEHAQVDRIILFGSVARGEAGMESDVDLFVESEKEKHVRKILERYYASSRWKNYWKAKGIENSMKLTIGRLDDWKDLKNSIIANGITLYGKFAAMPDGEMNTLFSWENLKPESKRVLVNKKIFGYTAGKKQYPGLLERYHGERIGKGTILIPDKHQEKFKEYFRKKKITVKIRRVLQYS